MLSMLVQFSTTCSVSGCSTTRITALTPCKDRRLFTVAGDNSHVLTPIPMHLIPIPILFSWLILLTFPRESHGTDGIPVFPIPMHTSNADTVYGWRRGVVVSRVRQWTKLTHVGPGYNWDGWPSSGGYTISGAVTSQLGQLSLASLRGSLIEYQLRLG